MEPETLDFLNEESTQYLRDLSERIRKDEVVLFAGAGLSLNAHSKEGASGNNPPLWGDLAGKMLEKLYQEGAQRLAKEKYNYLLIADKFEAEYGRTLLNQLLDEAIEDANFEPGPLHELISRFNWEILTTNFDTLIERGFALSNKTPNVILSDSDISRIEKPRIFKINGCIKNARSQIIVTSEDFRTFPDRKPLIELYVKKCFIESTVLFVGFGLDDPAFKMIHGWVRDHLREAREDRIAYSIQSFVDEPTKKVWNARGIRFIELFPDDAIDYDLKKDRIHALFSKLYKDQTNDNKKRKDATKPSKENIMEDLEKCLDQFETKVINFKKNCEPKSKTITPELENEFLKCLQRFSPDELFEQMNQHEKKELKDRLSGKFIDLIENYFCKKQREKVLLKLLKEIIANLEKPGKKTFLEIKVTDCIGGVLYKLLMKGSIEIDNPNIWIMAMYTVLRIGLSRKLLPIDFFRKGFNVIRETALKANSEYKVSKDLHRYWLFSVILIGPFACAETLLNISRKFQPQEYPWDITEYTHYQLEVFFGDRTKCHDLFLRALNNFKTSANEEAFYKFLLLDTFLEEYEEKGFSDLFLSHTYRDLSGLFYDETYRFRNTLSKISFPIKRDYFKFVILAIFNAVNSGKSFMFTGLSSIILSLPEMSIEELDIKVLKQSSLGEIFLLAIIYDKPKRSREKEKELEKLINFMIDYSLINVSYFLRLLLFRLEGADLEKIEHEADNGVSRYLYGLVTFIRCALPLLEEKDLLEIKKSFEIHLIKIKSNNVCENMVRIIAYISLQLSIEDFRSVFKTIFSLASEDNYASLGLKYLRLPYKKQDDPEIMEYYQLQLILARSMESKDTAFDRDFIEFILNHNRDDLFSKGDARIDTILKNYFDIIIDKRENYSLQWLMDIQRFVKSGFIKFEEMAKEIENFIEAAFAKTEPLYEWRIFSEKMIPVYKSFASCFKNKVIADIIENYMKKDNGGEISEDLNEETQDSFAHLLKEIYLLGHHKDLNKKIIDIIKKFVKNSLTGGGYLGAFWEKLNNHEQKQLIKNIKALWMPPSEKNILKAVKAAGEFLKYKTDEEAMEELSNRLLYAVFSGSTAVKIAWCKTITVHVEEETNWYDSNKEKIIRHFDYLKMEKDLELLRQLLESAKSLQRKDINVGDMIVYLKDNSPYAEIRRAAGKF